MKGKFLKPLAELIHLQEEEVARHKWFESEKAGHDIGWENAFHDWIERHFPGWKQFQWQQAIQEAYRQYYRPKLPSNRRSESTPRPRKRTPLVGLETAARVLAQSRPGRTNRRTNRQERPDGRSGKESHP